MAPRTSERNPYVDLLRVFSIGMVVLGHWMLTSLTYSDGAFSTANILGDVHWTQWFTLLFQVIPLFFLAGGYSAAASWSAHLAAGGRAGEWLLSRAQRLLLPTALYVGVATLAVLACLGLGVDVRTMSLAGWAVALQLWFLPVYLGLLLLTPALHAAHRRWGLAVPAVLGVLGVAVDAVVIEAHTTPLGWLNYLLVWGALYQVGFCWRDGLLGRPRLLLPALGLGGALAYGLLVGVGPFPLCLIGVSGQRLDNTAPPSAALLAFALAQTAVFVALEPPVERLLRRPRAVRTVTRANALVMIVYLWHMVPVLILGAALYPTHAIAVPTPVDTEWWLLRIPWIAALTLLLAPLVAGAGALSAALLARSNDRTGAGAGTRDSGGRPAPQPLLGLLPGTLLAGYALYRFAIKGFAPDGQLPLTALACFAAGTALVLLCRPRVSGPARPPDPP
jgi:hypothetical protein